LTSPFCQTLSGVGCKHRKKDGVDGMEIGAQFLTTGLSVQFGAGWLAIADPAPVSSEGSNVFTTSLEAIVLGLVQGITEFLPISSTAHLLVLTKLLGWKLLGQKYFVDAIQFGSVIAVLIYFWNDLRQLTSGAADAFRRKDWQREEWKITLGILVGTVPALAGGYLLKDRVPEAPVVIALAAIVMGLLLGLAEKVGARKRKFDDLQVRDGILVGLGQMLAIIPGVSRSGSTLTVGLFLGLERQTAARFSFLLGLPTLAIATLYQSRKAFGDSATLIPMLVGIVSAFIFSYLSIAWLLRFLQHRSTWVFVWYRVAFGAAILAAVVSGAFGEG
jgi:undecaprenyl-diphosphatase